ncbi:MAG: hypothetical protein KGZ25_06895 [Planctomycetes bacterium]|nr:hypothetical protein [Planctomycetota bacterium]
MGKGENTSDTPKNKKDRLRFIKQRHRELILDGREGLADGMLEDEADAHHMLDEREDLHFIEELETQARI